MYTFSIKTTHGQCISFLNGANVFFPTHTQSNNNNNHCWRTTEPNILHGDIVIILYNCQKYTNMFIVVLIILEFGRFGSPATPYVKSRLIRHLTKFIYPMRDYHNIDLSLSLSLSIYIYILIQ